MHSEQQQHHKVAAFRTPCLSFQGYVHSIQDPFVYCYTTPKTLFASSHLTSLVDSYLPVQDESQILGYFP